MNTALRLWISIFACLLFFTGLQAFSRPALQGTKSIGTGGDYPSIGSAVADLHLLGVAPGGLIFSILPGVYTESGVEITYIGTQDTMVRFVAADSLQAPLFIPTGTNNSFAFKLNSAGWLSFENLRISHSSGSNALLYGFWLLSGTSNINIENCRVQLSPSSINSRAIYSVGSTGLPNNNLRIVSNTCIDAQSGIWIANNGGSEATNVTVEANNISGIRSTGILLGMCTNSVIRGNSIASVSSSASTVEGIRLNGSASSAMIDTNQIGPLASAASVFGIYVSNGSYEITSNRLRSFSSAASVTGIYIQNTPQSNVERNLLDAISSTGTAHKASGISVAAAVSIRLAANMISGINAPNSQSSPQVSGIFLEAATNASILYNSLLLKGNPASGNSSFSSAALYLGTTVTSVKIQNNILVNHSSSGTSANAKAVALWKQTSGFGAISNDSNCNIYHAGNPGNKNLISYMGSTAYAVFEDYRSAAAPRDNLSYWENPPFVSDVSPYDLHLRNDIATNASNNAIVLSAQIYDIDMELRHLSSPDIGADEGDFLGFGSLATPSLRCYRILSDVYLEWDTIPGANSYEIFSALTPYNVEFVFLAATANCSYVFPADHKGFFRVVAKP